MPSIERLVGNDIDPTSKNNGYSDNVRSGKDSNPTDCGGPNGSGLGSYTMSEEDDKSTNCEEI